MVRKTKVRIVGDPELAIKVSHVIMDHFDFSDLKQFNRAVGRDYAHSDAPGVTIYITIKKRKENEDE